jgi:hypothetical protein
MSENDKLVITLLVIDFFASAAFGNWMQSFQAGLFCFLFVIILAMIFGDKK